MIECICICTYVCTPFLVHFDANAMMLMLFIWFRLYYTKLGLGSPPRDYYVQVDTGSDILWVNCVDCSRCPRKSDLGVCISILDFGASASISYMVKVILTP